MCLPRFLLRNTALHLPLHNPAQDTAYVDLNRHHDDAVFNHFHFCELVGFKDSEGVKAEDEGEAHASDDEEAGSPGFAIIGWFAEERPGFVDVDEGLEGVVDVLGERESDANGEDEEVEALEEGHDLGNAAARGGVVGGQVGDPPLELSSIWLFVQGI